MKKGRVCLFFIVLMMLVPIVPCGCDFSTHWRYTDDESFFVDVDGWAYSEKEVNSIKQRITSEGLLDEFPLASIKGYRDSHGELRGDFGLLGSGTVRGSLGPKNTYLFFWTKDNITYISELPAAKIALILEEGTVQPTVRFKFRITQLNIWDKAWKENSLLLAADPNVLIDVNHIFLAFIKISPDKVGEYILIP